MDSKKKTFKYLVPLPTFNEQWDNFYVGEKYPIMVENDENYGYLNNYGILYWVEKKIVNRWIATGWLSFHEEN